MISILVDTNALIYFFDKKTEINKVLDSGINSGYELCYAKESINELKMLGRNDVAKLVDVLKFKAVNSQGTAGPVDDILMSLCSENGLYLLTFDRTLANKAIENGIPLVRIKGNHAEIEN